jgi:hypothetical protein
MCGSGAYTCHTSKLEALGLSGAMVNFTLLWGGDVVLSGQHQPVEAVRDILANSSCKQHWFLTHEPVANHNQS